MTIPRARVNGQAFAGTNYTFIKSGHGDTEVECKRHDLAPNNNFSQQKSPLKRIKRKRKRAHCHSNFLAPSSTLALE